MTKKVFLLKEYQIRQLMEALTCPVNRDMTRREHGCDDWGLFQNPGWLMDHYIENGGAEAFEKRRSEFEEEIEVPDPGTIDPDDVWWDVRDA